MLQRQILPITKNDSNGRLFVVPGNDGAFNPGSQAIMAWLFLGKSGRELDDPIFEGLAAEALQDCILAVSPTGASIFSTEAAEPLLAPLLALWRGLERRFVPRRARADTERYELGKARYFVELAHRCGIAAMPVDFDKDGGSSGAKMDVEKWALVAAHAVQGAVGAGGVGGGGFFTMRHEITPCLPLLRRLMSDVDARCLSAAAHQAVPRLLQHWREAIRALDAAPSPARRSEMTEADVAEPLTSFYAYGTIRRRATGEEMLPGRGARVLAGVSTGRREADTRAETGENGPVLGALGPRGAPALHLVLEAEEPSSGIRVARTYFLATGRRVQSVPERGRDGTFEPASRLPDEGRGNDAGETTASSDEDATVDSTSPSSCDAARLQMIYALLVHALRSAITTCSILRGEADLKRIESACTDAALQTLRSGIDSRLSDSQPELRDGTDGTVSGVLLPEGFNLRAALSVSIEAFDARGIACLGPRLPADAQGSPLRTLRYVRLALCGLPSVEPGTNGELLGSLVVADTVIAAHGAGSARGTAGGNLNLTSEFPYHRAWTGPGAEWAAVKRLRRAARVGARPGAASLEGRGEIALGDLGLDLGARVSGPFSDAALLLGGELRPEAVGDVTIFEHGIFFDAPSLGPVVFSMRRDVESVQLVDSDGIVGRAPTLMTLSLRGALANGIAGVSFVQRSSVVALALETGQALKTSAMQALPRWAALGEECARVSTELELNTARPGEAAQILQRFASAFRATKAEREAEIASAVAECAASDAERAVAAADGGDLPGLQSPAANAVPITLLAGAPGSGKHRLAAALSASDPEGEKFRVVDIGAAFVDEAGRPCDEASSELLRVTTEEIGVGREAARVQAALIRLLPSILHGKRSREGKEGKGEGTTEVRGGPSSLACNVNEFVRVKTPHDPVRCFLVSYIPTLLCFGEWNIYTHPAVHNASMKLLSHNTSETKKMLLHAELGAAPTCCCCAGVRGHCWCRPSHRFASKTCVRS
jgi:hypothetical protein